MPAKRFLIAGVLLALGATACGDAFEAGAAVVNGVSIGKDALAARIKQLDPNQGGGGEQVRREALRQLIQEELVRQEASDRGLDVTEQDVDELLAQVKSRYPTEVEFQQALTQAGFTLENLRKTFRDQLTIEKLAEAIGGAVSDAEVRQAYEQQKAQYEEARLRHILIRVEDAANASQVAGAKRRAEAALARVRAGETFASVAGELSEDPASKEQGGDLGFAPLDRYVPEFAQAAQSAKVGVPTEPVQSQFGWHVILVVARRTAPFSQVEEELRAQLRNQRVERIITEFLEGEFGTARIAVNPLYGDWDPQTNAVVEHSSFVPASPEPDPNAPPDGFGFVPGG